MTEPRKARPGTTTKGNDHLVVRAAHPTDHDGAVTVVTPESAGWTYSGIEVWELPDGATHTLEQRGVEALLVPLSGGCALAVQDAEGHASQARLTGRASVFEGPSDAAYLPVSSVVSVTADGGPLRFAVASARAGQAHPFRVIQTAEVRVDLRGAGHASRQVNNYTLGTDVQIERLLVCEVLTPAGNWSSYPPHKHDTHSDDERELEEIYYFEIADGPAGGGIAYHRIYSTEHSNSAASPGSGPGTLADDRSIDLLAEVRSGDVVLVPYGYHGPSMAAPGYDLYYLNVMAGPADDRRWLSVDDPAHRWVRDTWSAEPFDTRLPAARKDVP